MAASIMFAICFVALAMGLSSASTLPPTPQAVQQQQQPEAIGGFGVVGVPADVTDDDVATTEAVPTEAAPTTFGVVGVPADVTDDDVATTEAVPTEAVPITFGVDVVAASDAPATTTSSTGETTPGLATTSTTATTTTTSSTGKTSPELATTSTTTTAASSTGETTPETATTTTTATTTSSIGKTSPELATTSTTTTTTSSTGETTPELATTSTTTTAASSTGETTPETATTSTTAALPQPPFNCYDCNSGSPLPGNWKNQNCDVTGYVAQWYVPSTCDSFCFSSVGLYPAGSVYRGCASNLWLGGRTLEEGCFEDLSNDRTVCLCAGDLCNTHDLSERSQYYAGQYLAMQQANSV